MTEKVDIMKPESSNPGEPVKASGGMAHSINKEDWGGDKKPPFPRSELAQKTRGGMAFKVPESEQKEAKPDLAYRDNQEQDKE